MTTDNGWKRSLTWAGSGGTPGHSCPEGSCRVTPFREHLIEEVGADRTAMWLRGANPQQTCNNTTVQNHLKFTIVLSRGARCIPLRK